MRSVPKINLRSLILLFTLASVLVTLLNSLVVAFQVYRGALIRNTLASNEAYADTLARSISQSLDEDIQRLAYSANMLGRGLGTLQEELQRLLSQDGHFTSVISAGDTGYITATLPPDPVLSGKRLKVWNPQLLAGPYISSGFISLAGHLIVFISYPIRDPQGHITGVLGGTIHLSTDNSLSEVIGNHSFRNGTQVSLVDGTGTYLFHEDRRRVGEKIPEASLLQDIQARERGALSPRGQDSANALIGFAAIKGTTWKVVTQQPLEISDDMVRELIRSIFLRSVPVGGLGLMMIIWGAARISQPLQELAENARGLGEKGASGTLAQVNAWYLEAWRLKRALLVGIGLIQQRLGTLNEQAHCDALTGLANRRAMDQLLEELQARDESFSVIALDIDHFKRVNDTFGHPSGDRVLRHIAQLMLSHSRPEDVVCRCGGEEFLIILPSISLHSAAIVAERLRVAIQEETFGDVGQITVSLGVAAWNVREHCLPCDVLTRADDLLYAAKTAGRNRVKVESSASLPDEQSTGE